MQIPGALRAFLFGDHPVTGRHSGRLAAGNQRARFSRVSADLPI
jgi:hypothetical protein